MGFFLGQLWHAMTVVLYCNIFVVQFVFLATLVSTVGFIIRGIQLLYVLGSHSSDSLIDMIV